jgi:hypothetical protein
MVGTATSGVYKGLIPIEQAMQLDIRKLDPSANYLTTLNWIMGERTASMSASVTPEAVVLSYLRTPDLNLQPTEITERIPISWRRRHFGGREALFVCPGCQRHAFHLYFRSGRFRCRYCARMTYAVRNETQLARMIRRARKLRARLGGGPSLLDPIPPRPYGMWWSTYDRLCERLQAVEMALQKVAGLPP